MVKAYSTIFFLKNRYNILEFTDIGILRSKMNRGCAWDIQKCASPERRIETECLTGKIRRYADMFSAYKNRVKSIQ